MSIEKIEFGWYLKKFGLLALAGYLAGALVYIIQSRDVLLGGVALFALAAGMSVPLLLLGLSAGSLLPRAGVWMEGVKRFFGVLLIGGAFWLADSIATMRKNQDCVLTGRRTCNPIDPGALSRP